VQILQMRSRWSAQRAGLDIATLTPWPSWRTRRWLTLSLLLCATLVCSGCGFFFSSRTMAIGDRQEGPPAENSQEVLVTATSLILQTQVETCNMDACQASQQCYRDDLWWTIGLDDLTRGDEPNLAAGLLQRGRFPETLRHQAQPLSNARSSDGLRWLERPADACLYKVYEPGSFYPGYTIVSECTGPRKVVHVPSLSVPFRRYHTWWSYPILVVLLPPALLVDIVTMPIQVEIDPFGGCPHGDW